MTTTLPVSWGPSRRMRSSARMALGLPPLTRGASRLRALSVAGPQVPSGGMPMLRWNSWTARSVTGPKRPSTRPVLKPRSSRRRWSAMTSSPVCQVPGRCTRTRSPRRQLASSSARQVARPTMPSELSPRCCWKARTARSTPVSYSSDAAASSSRRSRRASRSRMSETTSPRSPSRKAAGAVAGSGIDVLLGPGGCSWGRLVAGGWSLHGALVRRDTSTPGCSPERASGPTPEGRSR